MDLIAPGRREVVFELDPGRLPDTAGLPPFAERRPAVARALAELPGVSETHVDVHGTWAMVTFDITRTGIAVISGCLSAHGLPPTRVRVLGDPPETEERT
jgi:copper chaperone CopZ